MQASRRVPAVIALSFALAFVSSASAFGQGATSGQSTPLGRTTAGVSLSGVTAPPHPSWLTDAILFEFFFKHVMLTQAHANHLLAMGRSDGPAAPVLADGRPSI